MHYDPRMNITFDPPVVMFTANQHVDGRSTGGTVDVVCGDVARIHVRDDVVLSNERLDGSLGGARGPCRQVLRRV